MAIDKKIAQSFYTLEKCNPRLSGNIKFVCDGNDIFIDSIDSNDELSRTLYKRYKVNTNNNLMANVKNYADLFTIKSDIYSVKKDFNNVVSKYHNQHSDIYRIGAYSDVSELYNKRFRFFSPIHINEEAKKPDVFCLYRIDRELYNQGNPKYLKELLYVHDFRTSELGKQLDRHIQYMKDSNFDMGIFSNFDENISYSGTSLNSGLVETRYEDDFNSMLANERTLTEFNNHIVSGFERNEIIDSRYLNLEYCFDIDLTNVDLNDKFIDVIGVYMSLESVSDVIGYNTSDFDFKLLEDSKKLYKHEGTLDISSLKDNHITVDTRLGVQYTSDSKPSTFTPLVMIEPVFIPNVGDRIVLSLDGNTEITYQIKESDIVSSSVIETAKKVVASFTEHARVNISNLFVSAEVFQDRYIVIKSLINDSYYNNIKVELLPPQYKVIEPLFTTTPYNNTFYSPSNASVLTTLPIGISANASDSVRLGTNLKKITFGARWMDYYFYNLEGSLSEDSDPKVFEIIKTEKTKMYNGRIVEHRAFDFDRETTYHEDVFDFELEAYKNWLLTEIDKPTFLGKYKGGATPSEAVLSAYKDTLRNIVNRYFNSIDISRNMLLKDLDTDTFEATSTKNEFDRLAENDNIELLKGNMVNQHINKFMYSNGLDVYNRPYTLNLNLPFRYDNFAPSLESITRDLRHSTHSWLVIGEGLPPYFKDLRVNGDLAVVSREVTSEQPIETIQRFYGDLGNATDIAKWNNVTNSTMTASGTYKVIFRPSSVNNKVERDLNIASQAIGVDVDFNYKFVLQNSTNTFSVVKIELFSGSTVYHSWNVERNVVSGVDLVVNEVKRFRLPLGTTDVKLRISENIGFTSKVIISDINFYKTSITIDAVNDNIKFDCDDVQGTLKHVSDMISGYTSKPITTTDILSRTTDVFNFIRSHSKIREEDGFGTCFFRGVKVVVDKKYKDWKFASILLTKTAPKKQDRSIELYENNTYKSLVLVVNMYLPEPVLTSLEQNDVYWLDRSLLYFSDGNYASEDKLSSFGQEEFSARIHDTSSPKTFGGSVVTNNWYFQQGGQNYVHVAKGILTRFNVDFTTILTLGNDFEVFFSDINPASTTTYGMKIVFKEVQEISTDYFWCKEIQVTIKETVSGTTSTITYNVLADYLADNNAFILKNRMDIVAPILLENAKYDRVLRNTSAIDRFSLLSTASIFDWLGSNKTKINKDDGTSYYGDVGVYKPSVIEGVISLKETNKSLLRLVNRYTNTYIRQNGAYEPITKQLRSVGKKFYTNYCLFGYSNKASNNDLLPSISSDLDRSNNAVWFYRNNYNKTKLDKFYRYYNDRTNYTDITWWASPNEISGEVSRVLSSSKELEFEYTYGGGDINMYNLVKQYMRRLLDNSGYNTSLYSNSTKISIMKLGNVDLDSLTLPQFQIDDYILNNFFSSVFSDVYVIEKVYDTVNKKQIDFIELENDVITPMDLTIGAKLKITIKRM